MGIQDFFFTVVHKHLDKVIVQEFGAAMGRVFALVGAISITLFTLWFIYQGWRIMTGKSRAPLMDLLMDSLRTMAILGLLTGSGIALTAQGSYNPVLDEAGRDGISINGQNAAQQAGNSMVGSWIASIRSEVTWLVTGSDKDVYQQIDENLKKMQAILTAINTINTAGDPSLESDKKTAMFLSGFGQASPAMVAGGLVLLNEISLWIGCMLGPIFTLMLLFDATKAFFWRWVNIMVSLLFSLAILAVMSKICVDMAGKYAQAVMLSKLFSLIGGGPSLMSTAVQQGGLGLLLTPLLITVPPSVANFFQATIGGITNTSMFTNTTSDQRKEMGGRPNSGAGGGVNTTNNNTTAGGSKSPAAHSPTQMLNRDAATGGAHTYSSYNTSTGAPNTGNDPKALSQGRFGNANTSDGQTGSTGAPPSITPTPSMTAQASPPSKPAPDKEV